MVGTQSTITYLALDIMGINLIPTMLVYIVVIALDVHRSPYFMDLLTYKPA